MHNKYLLNKLSKRLNSLTKEKRLNSSNKENVLKFEEQQLKELLSKYYDMCYKAASLEQENRNLKFELSRIDKIKMKIKDLFKK